MTRLLFLNRTAQQQVAFLAALISEGTHSEKRNLIEYGREKGWACVHSPDFLRVFSETLSLKRSHFSLLRLSGRANGTGGVIIMARGKMTLDRFAEAVTSAMVTENVSPVTLTGKLRRDFWLKVEGYTGQRRGAAPAYWAKHREELIKLLSGTVATTDSEPVASNTEEVAPKPAPLTVELDGLVTIGILEHLERTIQARMQIALGGISFETKQALRRMEERLTALLDQRVKEAVGKISVNGTRSATIDDPPKPEKTGRKKKKFAGKRANIRGLVDENLAKLLEKDCRERYDGNMSRTLTAILWRYFGKPRLSFESHEEQVD